jgi:hypothetical protein
MGTKYQRFGQQNGTIKLYIKSIDFYQENVLKLIPNGVSQVQRYHDSLKTLRDTLQAMETQRKVVK